MERSRRDTQKLKEKDGAKLFSLKLGNTRERKRERGLNKCANFNYEHR